MTFRHLGIRTCFLLAGLVVASIPGRAEAPAPALLGHGGPVRAIIVLADGKTAVSGAADSAIIVWNAESGAARRVLRFHDSAVNALVALDGQCFASGGEDARIAIWCGDADRPVRVLLGHQAPIAALATSSDGRFIASASWDRTVRLWPLTTGDVPPRIVAEHAGPVNGVAFLAGGISIASASYDGEVRITPASGAALTARLPAAINGLANARSGHLIAAGADGTLRTLDTGLAIKSEVELPHGPLTAVAIAPDGRTIATAGLRTPVTLLDAATGKELHRILGPGLPVWSLAFSPDGKSLFSGGVDRAVRRWDVATGDAVGAMVPPADKSDPANAADPGAKVFKACAACHSIEPGGAARAGPSFVGLFGRRIGTLPGYIYSEALTRMDIVWTAETVSKLFEVGPAAYTPGTKMPEQRITDPEDRKALVDWLARVTKP